MALFHNIFSHLSLLVATLSKLKEDKKFGCQDLTTGKIYLPGEGWDSNDCVSCFCSSDGQQVCHETRCSVSKCKNPMYLQGRCCPVCPNVFHSGTLTLYTVSVRNILTEVQILATIPLL